MRHFVNIRIYEMELKVVIPAENSALCRKESRNNSILKGKVFMILNIYVSGEVYIW
jgi:hypothetical protein